MFVTLRKPCRTSYLPVLLDRLYLLFYVTPAYFVSHFSSSPFSVLFKPGESVHLTSSVPGNRSTFFHPRTAVTMTTLNNRQRRAGWRVGQQNERSGDNGGDEKWEQRERERERDGGKKQNSLHLRESERTGLPLCRTHMINKDDFNTIFENSIQFFLMPPLFLTLRRNKNQALTSCWTWRKGSGTTYVTLWFKVEIWRQWSACAKAQKTSFLDACTHTHCLAREQNCDNHNNNPVLISPKESSMLFFHTQFYCTGDECGGIHHVQCVYCDWKDFDNLEKDYATRQQVYAMLCITGFCRELHTLETGNEYALSVTSPAIIWIYTVDKAACKITQKQIWWMCDKYAKE